MAHRVIRFLSLVLASSWILASCLAQGPSTAGGPAGGAGEGSGSEIVAPSGNGAAADDTSAEPKPFPSGVASPGVDVNDPDAVAIAHSDVRGSYSTVCHGGEHSRFQVDGEIVTTWEDGGESCFPMFSRKLVSVVTVDGEERWSQHPVESCKFSHVIIAPEFGPRKFYLVKCEGLVCRPKEGDAPIPSPDFKPALFAKVPTLCLQAQ